MFNATQERVQHIPVSIKLSDGRLLSGKFIIAETSTLLRTLNGEGKFAVFVDYQGNHKLIAKSSIVEANEKKIAKVRPLSCQNDNGFDPYQILEVEPHTSAYLIDQQFKKLMRKYHPQRYTHPDMPAEIAQYAQEKSLLLQQAYAALTQTDATMAQAG